MLEYGMAVKALAELVSKLDASISDRRMRDTFLPLKEKALEVQAKHLEAERQHREEIERLKAEHADAVAKLEDEHRLTMSDAEARHQQEMTDLNAKYLAAVRELEEKLPAVHEFSPSSEHEKILVFLTQHGEASAPQISQWLGISLVRAEHRLCELHDERYVSKKRHRMVLGRSSPAARQPDSWFLDQAGRSYLVEQDLA